MRTRTRIWFVSLLAILASAAAALAGVFNTSHAQSTSPDYGKVDDFLNGGQNLLRNDDLFLTFTFQATSGEYRNVLFSAGMNNSNPTVLNYLQQTIPFGQAGCQTTGGCNYDYHGYSDQAPGTAGAVPVIGRFFNSERDTAVHYPLQLRNTNAPLLVSLTGETITPPGSPTSAPKPKWLSAQTVSFVTGATRFLSSIADFNGDGYDDLLMGYSNPSALQANPRMRIATAVDAKDPAKGFRFGPEFSLTSFYAISEMTSGDFNGDGRPEIASLVEFSNGDLYLATYHVDPQTLTISDSGRVSLNTKRANLFSPHRLQITAGRFTAAAHQQLVVGSQRGEGLNIKIQIIDFDPNSLQPKLMTTWEAPDAGHNVTLKLKAGRFNWSSPYEQIAWMSMTSSGTRLSVLKVDPLTLLVSRAADIPYFAEGPDVRFLGYDIAVGNFDHIKQSVADPTKQERDPNLQIALLGVRENTVINNDPNQRRFGTATLYIFDVAPDAAKLDLKSATLLNEGFFGGQTLRNMSITAGDLRGRSFRLGKGYKVTVDRVQPAVVLAAPPMHADYVYPAINQPPTVLNLSVAPDGFKSEYEQTESRDAKVTDTQTTSSSFAGEQSISSSFTLGQTNALTGELENGVKITDTFKAKQDLKDSNDTINGAFNSAEYEISQETGLSDVVWFKDTSYYLYVYPVLGRKVCPADKAGSNGNCADRDKVPLQIMFSASKQATVHRLASDTLEWYQPPWEPGNLFSYPAGFAQLKQYIPDISLLTQELSIFATDDAAATLKTTWANGKTTGQNIEHEQLFTEENDLSIEGVTEVKAFGVGVGVEAGLALNFGGSNGHKSLTESETQLESARGITVTKAAAFADPFRYKYFFSPYIFGKQQPVGFADPVDSTADLLAYGTMRSAFTADMLARGAGGWWAQSPYQQAPDVAVNHPNRWQSTYLSTTSPTPLNCVGLNNGSMNCITPSEREPANPWLDAFHDMRGFFITDARNPVYNSNPFVAGGGGAQLETAITGDRLMLSTRVYNYSFRAMPAGARVKVRFYGMELNEQNRPVKEGGGSFLIGEAVLNPIAPFSNDPRAPLNWVLAKTTFDTTGRANQVLAFWVAVWIEDANGKQVQEVTGHGLTGIPKNEGAPSFTEITKLEELVDNPLAAAPAKISFSNNIGFYHSVFHILPKATATAALAASFESAVSDATEIKIEKVEVAGTTLKLGQSAEASATLRGGAQELLGVMVYFYDGDPGAGGRLFDIERIARLRANAQQRVNVRFRPQICGAHQIFVRVDPDEEHTVSSQAAQALQVECPTPICVSQVCMRSPQYYALNLKGLAQGMVTVLGGGLNQQVSTADTKRLRLLLQGGASRQQQLNQQFVATQLSLLAQAGGTQTALQSHLLCYKVNFQPTQLGTGVILNPSMTLGELFDQALQAGRSGDAIDQRLIANLLQLLNGDDPQGRCAR